MSSPSWNTIRTEPGDSLDGASQSSYTKRWALKGSASAGSGFGVVIQLKDYKTGDPTPASVREGDEYSDKVPVGMDIFTRPVQEVLPWLRALERERQRQAPMKDIQKVFTELNKLIRSSDIPTVDNLVSALDEESLSFELKIAILRYTYPLKSQLRHWKKGVSVVYQELEDLGLSSEDLLKGLT